MRPKRIYASVFVLVFSHSLNRNCVFLCFYSIAVSVAGTFGILCPGVLFIFIRVLFCGYGQLQATLIGHRLRFIKH